MVDLHETIKHKPKTAEETARAAGATALEFGKTGTSVPAELRAQDGQSYANLSGRHWHLIAMYQEPELFSLEPTTMPFSEEALGDDF